MNKKILAIFLNIAVIVEGDENIINYELFAKMEGILVIMLIITSLVSIVIANKIV